MNLRPALINTINSFNLNLISEERRAICQPLINYIKEKRNSGEEINLNFICTHNSRRSQFSQLWAQTAAFYYEVEMNCYSGGVEATAFNERAVASVERSGFKVAQEISTSRRLRQSDKENPLYTVSYADEAQPLVMFSKLFDNSSNPSTNFAAIMTCDHADENCPFIPGTEVRIPLLYEDPKAFDNTNGESRMYDERSLQIASELFYVFSQVKYHQH